MANTGPGLFWKLHKTHNSWSLTGCDVNFLLRSCLSCCLSVVKAWIKRSDPVWISFVYCDDIVDNDMTCYHDMSPWAMNSSLESVRRLRAAREKLRKTAERIPGMRPGPRRQIQMVRISTVGKGYKYHSGLIAHSRWHNAKYSRLMMDLDSQICWTIRRVLAALGTGEPSTRRRRRKAGLWKVSGGWTCSAAAPRWWRVTTLSLVSTRGPRPRGNAQSSSTSRHRSSDAQVSCLVQRVFKNTASLL